MGHSYDIYGNTDVSSFFAAGEEGILSAVRKGNFLIAVA